MTFKALYLFCAQVILVQTISGFCNNGAWPAAMAAGEGLGWAAPGFGYEAPLMAAAPYVGPPAFLGACDLAAIPSSYGGGFAVSSMSPIPPQGVSLMSENAIEGVLLVGGELPFLGTVGLEGALPTAGVGTVTYGCGNGNVGMVSEDVMPMAGGLGWPAAGMNYGPVMNNGFGYGAGWPAPAFEFGLPCGAVY